MLLSWILIFYLSGYSAGGPATAEFSDQAACENAGKQVKDTFKGRYEGHVCVPFTYPPRS